MEKAARVRMLLHLRAAHAQGATIQAAINGTALPSCALPAGAWTDCRLRSAGKRDSRGSQSAGAERRHVCRRQPIAPAIARELAFVMQASRVRIGQ